MTRPFSMWTARRQARGPVDTRLAGHTAGTQPHSRPQSTWSMRNPSCQLRWWRDRWPLGTGRGPQTPGCTAVGTCHPPTSPRALGGLSCSAPLCPRPSEGTMCLAVLSRVGLEAPPACLPIFLDRSFFPPSWCCRTRLGVLYLGPSHTCLPSPPAAPQISSPLLAWLSPRPQPGSARDLPPSVCMNPPNTADLRCCASPPSRDQDRRWSGQVPGVPSQSPQSVK